MGIRQWFKDGYEAGMNPEKAAELDAEKAARHAAHRARTNEWAANRYRKAGMEVPARYLTSDEEEEK